MIYRLRANLFATALTACACMAAAAGPRSLAIDADTLKQQAAPQREQEVSHALQAWKLAWELGEADTYLAFYDPRFHGEAPTRAQWEKQRRARLAHAKIALRMENLRIRVLSDSEAEVRFVQHYASAGHRDVGHKRMRLQRHAGAWRITEERWTPHA
jgi:murein L,D-transpeptidase YafK